MWLSRLPIFNKPHRIEPRAPTHVLAHTFKYARIFKHNRILPFKPKFRHTLEEGDEAKRLDFCLEMGNRVLNDVGFHKRILFSDESTFSTNGGGVVSSHHCRYRTRMFFQQDGCSAHHAVTVRNWLNSELTLDRKGWSHFMAAEKPGSDNVGLLSMGTFKANCLS
ncbi:hypothetical protein NQ318_014461 [Aromia moschata]|uniref:Transposase n=1 Tax=Aromia moschata TaxID=1265417 RepID=A0AAV8XV18_9CUCU|nr:hypothetical protein NQ318_014461 [Aromia moschata]